MHSERAFAIKLMEHMVVPTFVLSADCRVLIWNRACERLTGVPAAEVIGTSNHWRALYDEPRPCLADLVALGRVEEIDHLYAQHGATDAIRHGLSAENWCVMPRLGKRHYMAFDVGPIYDESGRLIAVMETLRDLTERKLAEDLRQGQAQILEMIAMNAEIEDVLIRLIRLIEQQCEGVCGSILLLDQDGLHLRSGAAPSLPQAYSQALDGLRIGPKVGSCGTAVYRREPVIVADVLTDPLWDDFRDLIRPFGLRSCWSVPIMSHSGAVLGAFAMYSSEQREPTATEIRLVEMTTRIAGIAIERKRAEDRIQFMAHHDPLTGLPNRMLLVDRLSQAILHAQGHDLSVTVVFVDVDNFKLVNDSFGHNAGDELLKTVAARVVDCLRGADTVVRLGGDEFVIVMTGQAKDTPVDAELIQNIRTAIAEPILLDERPYRITTSMGVASFPSDGGDAETLLAHADAAMYAAKDLGRDNFQFYAPEMNKTVRGKLSAQEELRQAVARSEFHLLYQPQVDMRTGELFAVEALLRWDHPTRGLIPPSTFIPIAEETGIIVAIGDWVLHAACRQNKAWQDAGLPKIAICVNVSARQFRERNWVSRVTNALAESGLEAHYLELELTESMIMQDSAAAVAKMHELGALGIRFAIDDFGTGYSNLSALKTFPVARLKIDRSFVGRLPNDENDQAITAAVISMGQSLNMRVIAEGVETDQQLAFLVENNCDEMQGYLFSKPVAPEAIEALIKNQNRFTQAALRSTRSRVARSA